MRHPARKSLSTDTRKRRAGCRLTLCSLGGVTLILLPLTGAFASDLDRLPPLSPCAPGMQAATRGIADPGRPPEVLSWRHQIFDRQAYEALARDWEAHVDRNPRDVRARVEWADAVRYAGRFEESRKIYAQAFEIDSADAVAIVAHACWAAHKDSEPDWRLSHERFLRAAQADPDYPLTYYSLWSTALRSGDEALATECLRRLVALGEMPAPLLDFGYNLIAGAPPGAIIFTNGDNDTYTPLACQAVYGLRPDVSIVNLSLLNTHWHIRYWRDRGVPITLSDGEIASLKDRPEDRPSARVQQHIFENLKRAGWPRPLFYAVTVSQSGRVLDCKLVLEGLIERIVPAHGDAVGSQETHWMRLREGLDTAYRLDSATDPFVDWEREQAMAMMTINYGVLLGRLGEWLMEVDRRREAGPYLYRAIEIFAFHGHEKHARKTLDAWAAAAPQAELLPLARELVRSK